MDRRVAELNFLRFLPADKRQSVYDSWYKGKLSQIRREKEKDIIDIGPDIAIPTGIAFKTDDPKTELQKMLLEHIRFTRTKDSINRPQQSDASNPDQVTSALRSIVAAGNQQEPSWRKFKTMLPEASFLRIDSPGKDPMVYTMTLDRDLGTKAFALSVLQNADPSKAKISIYPGILTAYPNFMFRIDEKDVSEFAAKLIDANTSEKFTALVERWGVRRSNPDFWQVLNSITDYVRRTDPLRAGTFDINRYKNL